MTLLGASELINWPGNALFLRGCQHRKGGFGREIGISADLAHAFFALSGLSLSGEAGLQPIHPDLGVTVKKQSINHSIKQSIVE